MLAPLFTRLHKLAEMIDPADLPASAHHYVIGDDLMAAMPRTDVKRSIAAMIEAGICRLPFPEMMVEFSVEHGVTRFVWLSERPGSIEATTLMLTAQGLATVPTKPAVVTIQGDALHVGEHADERDGQAIGIGASFALLMLNVRGVDKQLVDAVRLNVARAKAGKPRVPTHTVLRIGIVYDRHGKPASKGGAPMRVYLVPGHARRQAYGPRWQYHRTIYVEPFLVNFRDGDTAPVTVPRVVKMGRG